jgi:hypothetical protein
MADGALTIQLGTHTVEKLTAQAARIGVTPEELVAMLLEHELFNPDQGRWIGDNPRTTPPGVNEDGARDWTEVLPEMQAYADARFGTGGD